MFESYLKIALRNLSRQKLFSSINILGLAVGLAACILILLYVFDELSYDRYHPNADRIYRVWVEGAVGGIVVAIVIAFIARATIVPLLTVVDALVLGLTAPVMAVLGDLVESLMKRDVRIKDTSRALPGHGGMLDRFDSVLFVAPLVYSYLRFLVV